MTRGEKIAWIWVWGAIAVLSVALAFMAWRYWSLPFTYFDAFVCQNSNNARAVLACERLISNDQAPVEPRSTALRKLAEIAESSGQQEIAVERLTLLIQLGAATAEDWNLRGLGYYSLRDYDKAANDFAQAAQMNSAVGVYWANLGDAQIEIKKYSEALQNYTASMRNNNDTAEVRGNRGWANYQLGNYEDALKDYDSAIATDAAHADNINERGLVRHALEDYESALADYTQSLKLKPDRAVVLTNRAITHSRIDNIEAARQDLDRAIRLDPNYAAAHLEKAWLLIDEIRPESALLELKEIERIAPLDIGALEARCRARLALGDWAGAIADADRAITFGSTDNWPYELRAVAKRVLGDHEGSIADIDVVLKRYPKSMRVLVTRAISLQLAGRTEAAIAEMDQAIKENNEPPYAYEIRSYLNLARGKLKEAVDDARQAVALAPQSYYSATALGWALLENKEPSAAEAECSRALSIKETSGALSCRAVARLALQQQIAALADANRALELSRISSATYVALGRIDLVQDKAQNALEKFDQALKFETFGKAEILMYRGDAERALGDLAQARLDYQEAKKRDFGLYAKALDDRLATLPAQ